MDWNDEHDYGLVQTSAPATEPITSTEAKAYLRQDETADDTLIQIAQERGLPGSSRAGSTGSSACPARRSRR